VALKGMAELVVAEAQRRRGCPLVEAISAEPVLEQLALVIRNGRAEIAGAGGRRRARRLSCLLLALVRGDQRRPCFGQLSNRWRPWRMERVEVDFFDRAFRILVPVDCALDDVAKLADVSGPAVGLEFRQRAGREAGPVRPVELDRHSPAEMLNEQRDVALACAERRQGDDLEREAV